MSWSDINEYMEDAELKAEESQSCFSRCGCLWTRPRGCTEGYRVMERSLTIVVPTVPGREAWLGEALSSIRTSIGAHDVQVVVSGNGTKGESGEIAISLGCEFIQHDQPMSSEEHGRILSSLADTKYLWPFADDDIMPPDAVSVVLRALGENNDCVALLGRARTFSDPALCGLGTAVPLEMEVGCYGDLESLARATKGWAALGAIVVQPSCLSGEDYDRFLGTSHAFFGQVWMSVERHINQGCVVVPEVLVDSRMAEKAWDESYIRTRCDPLR
jgi:hypothetical protein